MKVTEEKGPEFQAVKTDALRKLGQVKVEKETKTGGKKSG